MPKSGPRRGRGRKQDKGDRYFFEDLLGESPKNRPKRRLSGFQLQRRRALSHHRAGTSGVIWAHLGPSGAIWSHLGPSGAIWTYLEPSGAIWIYLVPSWAIWGHLGPSGAIWTHLGPSGPIRGHCCWLSYVNVNVNASICFVCSTHNAFRTQYSMNFFFFAGCVRKSLSSAFSSDSGRKCCFRA